MRSPNTLPPEQLAALPDALHQTFGQLLVEATTRIQIERLNEGLRREGIYAELGDAPDPWLEYIDRLRCIETAKSRPDPEAPRRRDGSPEFTQNDIVCSGVRQRKGLFDLFGAMNAGVHGRLRPTIDHDGAVTIRVGCYGAYDNRLWGQAGTGMARAHLIKRGVDPRLVDRNVLQLKIEELDTNDALNFTPPDFNAVVEEVRRHAGTDAIPTGGFYRIVGRAVWEVLNKGPYAAMRPEDNRQAVLRGVVFGSAGSADMPISRTNVRDVVWRQIVDHISSAIGPFRDHDAIGIVDTGIDMALGGWVRQIAVPVVRAVATTARATGSATKNTLVDRRTLNRLGKGSLPNKTDDGKNGNMEKP